jgi:DNA-binding NtrC family response regulator/tetratricopeptide (TPR) repeat protein
MANLPLDRFEVIRTLHVLRHQATFLAHDHLLETKVLVKLLPRKIVLSEKQALREGLCWYHGVDHPHLLRILDAGLTPKRDLYYVREYVPNSDCLSPTNTTWLPLFLGTVQFLHSHDRVHGSIKPSNIFIRADQPHLADARIAAAQCNFSAEENIRFSAPEVLMGETPTIASDLYSVGALLYRVFSGKDPFDDFDLPTLKNKYMWATARPLLDISHVSNQISELVAQLLNKDPELRRQAFHTICEAIGARKVRPSQAAYIGKPLQVEQIRNAFQKAPADCLRVVLIEGEPGIGKSRLISEFRMATAVEHIDCVTSACAGDNERFGPILHGIKRLLNRRGLYREETVLLRELGSFSPTLSKYLLEGAELSEDSLPAKRVISDLIGFLARLARTKEIVLVLEDIHLADAGTLEFLENLSFRAAEAPISLLLTRRTRIERFPLADQIQSSVREHFTHIRLASLGETASISLYQSLMGSPAFQDRLGQYAGGNPWLIREYATSSNIHTNGVPEIRKDIAHELIPDLSKQLRRVAEALCVFEEPVSACELEDLASIVVGELEQVLAELAAIGFIEEFGIRFRIKYELVRKAVYVGIPPARKATLHRLAFTKLKERDSGLQVLAHHAYQGKMFHEAADLFQTLARKSFDERSYSTSVLCFLRAEHCLRRTGRTLMPADNFKLAICYARSGRHALARRTYNGLLAMPTFKDDALLMSAVYATLAGPEQAMSADERVRLYQLAIAALPGNSPELSKRYAQLSATFLRMGKLSAANDALVRAEQHGSSIEYVEAARASLLINSGNFRGALSYLKGRSNSKIDTIAELNNLAFCFEWLGDLKKAKEIQLQAQEAAARNGHIPIQVISLNNLGSIETKLGNLNEAGRLFGAAIHLLSQLQARDKGFYVDSLAGPFGDAAMQCIHLGEYKRADQYLGKIGPSRGSRYEMDDIFTGFARCELALRLGQQDKAKTGLESISESEVFNTDFIIAERAIFESRIECGQSPEVQEALHHAVRTSAELGTLYQHCRALNALARRLIAADAFADAMPYINRTVGIAKMNGYKLLLPEAILLKGICSRNFRQKESQLYSALGMATEIGLPELVAEISLHLAECQMAVHRYVVAKDHLLRSIALIDGIGENLPLTWRPRYTTRMRRRKAQELLDICIKAAESTPLTSTYDQHQNVYFEAIYKLTVPTGAAPDVPSFVTSVLQALDHAVRRPTILLLINREEEFWHSLRMQLSDDLAKHIRSLATRSNAGRYFGVIERTERKHVISWIPIKSRYWFGGIYVECRQGRPGFSEREMEFLTIVGTIASGALEQIENRKAERTTMAAEISEFRGIIGASKAIREIYSQIEIAAGNAATVLIEGESGTGKELVAKAIHASGPRATGPFVPVDCGAIPEGLIEAELFGAKKGSYTGAITDRPGLFEAANRGTIFLDEISNTSPTLQAKLLRVLQEREVRRLGETKGRSIDVRLIVASNADLDALVQAGTFRKDLLYRLKVLHIKVPPLRNRREDIPMLAQCFLARLNTANNTKKQFAAGVITQVAMHAFPGNVRELQNAVERAFFSAKGMSVTSVPIESVQEIASLDEVATWFNELAEGRKDFWTTVQSRYKRRDISREKVLALVDFGLRSTRGSYKAMASTFRLKEKDYRRFMDFLRRNDCLLDFRPYRKGDLRTQD